MNNGRGLVTSTLPSAPSHPKPPDESALPRPNSSNRDARSRRHCSLPGTAGEVSVMDAIVPGADERRARAPPLFERNDPLDAGQLLRVREQLDVDDQTVDRLEHAGVRRDGPGVDDDAGRAVDIAEDEPL